MQDFNVSDGAAARRSDHLDASLLAVERQLAGMRGWTMLAAVVGFFVGGLLAILGLVVGALMPLGLAGGRGSQTDVDSIYLIVGAVFLSGAAVYLVGAFWLALFSNRIARYFRHRTPAALDAALLAQKSFWKYCGIAAILGICLLLVAFFCVAPL